jgi:hypothetical protein
MSSGTLRLGVLALAALAACDLPTAAPKLEQQWAVPVASSRIAVSDLLPASAKVVQGALRVSLPSAGDSVQWYQVCGAAQYCLAAGMVGPKPAFQIPFSVKVQRPADFASATLAGGDTVHLVLAHAWGFDVLRPAGAATPGSLSAQLVIGADTLRALISGATTPWPSGTTLDVPLVIPAGATLSADVALDILVDSPAGDAVTNVGPTRYMTAVFRVGTVGVTTISAQAPTRSLASQDVVLDLSRFDSDIAAKAQSAELTLAMTNPLAVAGQLSLAFNGSHGAVIPPKTVNVSQGSSVRKLTLTRSELDQLLGQRITLGLTGQVTATHPSGLVTFRPTDDISIDGQLVLTVVLP